MLKASNIVDSFYMWCRVGNGVLPKFELLIFGIVGQKVQKWVKLGKIAVFRLSHAPFLLEYYKILRTYDAESEMGCCQILSIFGIVCQKVQKLVKLGKIAVFRLSHVTFLIEYYKILRAYGTESEMGCCKNLSCLFLV